MEPKTYPLPKPQQTAVLILAGQRQQAMEQVQAFDDALRYQAQIAAQAHNLDPASAQLDFSSDGNGGVVLVVRPEQPEPDQGTEST